MKMVCACVSCLYGDECLYVSFRNWRNQRKQRYRNKKNYKRLTVAHMGECIREVHNGAQTHFQGNISVTTDKEVCVHYAFTLDEICVIC